MQEPQHKSAHKILGFLFISISLAAAGAIVFLWIATDHRTLLKFWTRDDSVYVFRADAWRFCFERLRSAAVSTPFQGGWSLKFRDGSNQTLGIIPEYCHLTNGYGFTYWTWNYTFPNSKNSFAFVRATIPFWPLLLICLTPSVLYLRRAVFELRQHRRKAEGLCQNCGYDLRATPGRCPECGMVTVKPETHDADAARRD